MEGLVAHRTEMMMNGNGDSAVTLGHFLQPASISANDQFPVPVHTKHYKQVDENKLGTKFYGNIVPREDWKRWVSRMECLHSQTWKSLGIYQAIKSSTHSFHRSTDLILALGEKWCSETQTFIFTWGEATITLEDMMAFGFPVLGSSVRIPLETDEQISAFEALQFVTKALGKTSAGGADSSEWTRRFRATNHPFEHEAFLACWLCKFVFPNSHVIRKKLLIMAIHLAGGTRLALAPALLATLYNNLGLIKEKIKQIPLYFFDNANFELIIRSPIHLVQIWTWERFVKLRPNPNPIGLDEPRLAKWSYLSDRVQNIRTIVDESVQFFDWRPYTKPLANWQFLDFYVENECIELAPVSEAVECFVMCTRISKLIGPEYIEPYFPNRVARQFGLDQDIPGRVDRVGKYDRAMDFDNVYVPSRVRCGLITNRYYLWWYNLILDMWLGNKSFIRERTKINNIRAGLSSRPFQPPAGT